MIERIRLVAWTELRATLLTRAFIMMVLTPIIAVLVTPLIVAPIVLLSQVTGGSSGEAAAEAAMQVEVYTDDGSLFDALTTRMEGSWGVVRSEANPADAAVTLYDVDVDARLILDASAVADGHYLLHIPRFTPGGPEREDVDKLTVAVRETLTDARLAQAGLSLDAVKDARTIEGEINRVDASAEQFLAVFKKVAEYAVPGGVLFMMFGALSMAGQGLLTSTLEEKSTRVAEVLLGAVSPVELLTGKILGQLGVSIIFSVVWGGPALLALAWFGSYFLGPFTVLYLILFIGCASVSWAAVMGGIGSAVNDLTEAQHLLAPLFMVMMMMFMPAVFAIVDPTSPVIVAASLLPPCSPAVMAARLTSSIPPPHWQVWISLLTSGAFAVFMLWLAGRLFRIGLLLKGSPPNVRTLIRWVMTS